MVDFLDLYDVYDRHGHIDVDRNVQVVLFVKTERGYFLVVVVLGAKKIWTKLCCISQNKKEW